MKEFIGALGPVRRRVRRNRVLYFAALGLAVGAGAALGIQIASFFLPLPGKMLWMAACLPTGALLFAGAASLRRITLREAAAAADACGLQERAITALELSERSEAANSPGAMGERATAPEISEGAKSSDAMRELVTADACGALKGLDLREIRGRKVRRPLLLALAFTLAAAGMFLIPCGPDRMMAEENAFRQRLTERAEAVAAAAEADAAGMKQEEDRKELSRLATELKRDLSESRDKADALLALDRAEQRMEALREKTAADALRALTQALAGAGMNDLAAALGGGNEEAVNAAMAQADAQTLNAAAEGLDGGAKALAEALASSSAGGNAAQAVSGAARDAGEHSVSQTAQALRELSSSLGGQGGSSTSGSSGNGKSGSGAGAGESPQSGGGAGRGSTNREQGPGGSSSGGTARGSEPAEYREGTYESIYDPERTEAAFRDEMTNQQRLEGESAQTEAGLGAGNTDGSVPYGRVIGEYAQTESLAADRENLSRQEREWVSAYYAFLTE